MRAAPRRRQSSRPCWGVTARRLRDPETTPASPPRAALAVVARVRGDAGELVLPERGARAWETTPHERGVGCRCHGNSGHEAPVGAGSRIDGGSAWSSETISRSRCAEALATHPCKGSAAARRRVVRGGRIYRPRVGIVRLATVHTLVFLEVQAGGVDSDPLLSLGSVRGRAALAPRGGNSCHLERRRVGGLRRGAGGRALSTLRWRRPSTRRRAWSCSSWRAR